METTIEVTAICFADVVMVGHAPTQTAGQALPWFVHLRNGNSYMVSEAIAKDAATYLVTQNMTGQVQAAIGGPG